MRAPVRVVGRSDRPVSTEGFLALPFDGIIDGWTHVRYYQVMPHEIGTVIAPDPTAFFLTWTTYGSWLPGDARGWVGRRGVIGTPSASLARSARAQLRGAPVVLTLPDGRAVEAALQEQCDFREWYLHTVACRTGNVHVVVSAPSCPPVTVLRA
jgi:hypothetical protein